MPVVVVKNDFPAIAAKLHVAGIAAERTTAQSIAREAKSRAPTLTGRLRGSIRAVGNTVEATVRYAGYVEGGTNDTAPQPFFYRSVSDQENTLVGLLMAVLR